MEKKAKKESSIIETLQSLIVAFVLAMVFRGFVVEGFVIPTGSMAPTLLGQHLLKHSDQTGQDFAVGFDPGNSYSPESIADPLLGRNIKLSMSEAKKKEKRGGDHVLVLKTLYPFFGPKRFDVVVFKNPTDTQGTSSNYIKRLIGLPNETLWIADGDIFVRKDNEPESVFKIQRKPEHIQQSLWRKVSDSDAIPTDTLALSRPWRGPPWIGSPVGTWKLNDRTWVCSTASPSTLTWDNNRILIDDWLPYNMLSRNRPNQPLSDVRVSATLTPDDESLNASFSLEAVQHRFVWMIYSGQAVLSMSTLGGEVIKKVEVDVDVLHKNVSGARQPIRLECWHVDQMMVLYLNGARVAELLYEFSPEERIRLASNADPSVPVEEIAGSGGKPPSMQWQFDGSPLKITKLQVDHDLYYNYEHKGLPLRATNNPTKEGNEELVRIGSRAFGTHPDKLAVLGKDQFMMAGDNSAYSLDGRLWGNPDEFVAAQIDDSPFVVHRDLLIGKAWGVYWLPPPMIPEFNRFRFIR